MIDWNYMLSQIATVAFDILYFGAIIGTIVIIILDNRNPVKTMAWILILLFLPIVGLVFYFFFGRSQRRERIIGQKSYDRLLKKPMAEYLAQDCSDVPYEYSRLIQLFQQTNLFTSRVNYRNHRKIVVIDGRVGFVGGMNLAERYMRGFSWGIWRDTHIMLEGKAVHGLQTAFLLDWYFVDRTLITASRYFPKIDSCGSSLVQIVTSEPIGPWKEIMQGLTVAITSAKKYFYMQTPYFLPTEPILAAMQTAALSGVDIRLMLPERADNWITHLGSRSYLADVMQAGVKVYFYKKGFLHSKLMVSDDMLSTVGSTNVDFRSFEHNFEVNAFMYDVETALEMKEIFLQDQRESTQIFLKNWGRRSWRQKAAESIVRLLAPLL